MLEKVKKAALPEVVKWDQPPPVLRKLRIKVEGVRPLLTHNPASMTLTAGEGEAKRATRIPAPEDEAEAGCYRFDNGDLGLMGEAFRAAILGAASAWKGKNRVTMKSKLAHITVMETLVPLTYSDGKPIREYEIDRRRAIVQKQGIIRARPRFNQWCATFTVEFDEQLMPDAVLIVKIAADAGDRMGVGDYRPNKNGPFGRYRVVEYSLLN